MLARILNDIKTRLAILFTPVDPEILAIHQELHNLDDFLKIQNLRRQEEIRFLKLRYGQNIGRRL